jgi:hypothetical protein
MPPAGTAGIAVDRLPMPMPGQRLGRNLSSEFDLEASCTGQCKLMAADRVNRSARKTQCQTLAARMVGRVWGAFLRDKQRGLPQRFPTANVSVRVHTEWWLIFG